MQQEETNQWMILFHIHVQNAHLTHMKRNNPTQEDKELLTKDLCARIPYGVMCCVFEHTNPVKLLSVKRLHKGTWSWRKGTFVCLFWNDTKPVDYVKPYLRPMSSMTEEEWTEYKSTWKLVEHDLEDTYEPSTESYDWLNAHHFDYRGLIEKGLALEAPENMYE